MNKHTPGCNCEVVRNNETYQDEIRFCPLHKAASDMHEALKYSQDLIVIARKYFPKSIRNTDRFQLENTCSAINAALRKAERG